MAKNNLYKKIKSCRLCESTEISSFCDLGEVPLGNNLCESKSSAKIVEAYPLAINRCNNCGHFQLNISVNPNLLYANNYTYLSSIGKTFVDHLQVYSNWVCKEYNLNKDSLVIDIGSNDGTCLSFFKRNNCKVLGGY